MFHFTPNATPVDTATLDESYFSVQNMVFRVENASGDETYYIANCSDKSAFMLEMPLAEKLVVKSYNSENASGNELTMTDVALEQYSLPETGGSGTYLFTILGLLILFGSTGCMIYRKIQRKEVVREN